MSYQKPGNITQVAGPLTTGPGFSRNTTNTAITHCTVKMVRILEPSPTGCWVSLTLQQIIMDDTSGRLSALIFARLQPRSTRFTFDYVKRYFDAYPLRRKFGFPFLGDLGHSNPSNFYYAAENIYNFHKTSQQSNLLNNTILIVLSDHGPRFLANGATLQGRL